MSTDRSPNPPLGEASQPDQDAPRIISLPLPRGWIDPNAAKVVRRLHHFDHQVYFVGGCVRDLLVGRYPKDFDVATSAKPREVKYAFRNCRLIGRRFRLAHILFRDTIVEVATFRRDPNADEDDAEGDDDTNEDSDLLIRDDNVFGTAYDDAFRRDFTINALYYDLIRGEVIDYVGGFEDIESRTIRTIGDPVRRFQEDPIRMLRAIKFGSSLGFEIEEQTWAAMKEVSGDLSRAAIPRIQEELFKMLRSGFSERSFELLQEAGLLRLILPDHSKLLRKQDRAAIEAAAAASEEEPIEAAATEGDEHPASEAESGPLAIAPPPPLPTDRLPSLRQYLDTFDHMTSPLDNHLYLAVLALHPSMKKVDLDLRASPQEQLTRQSAEWLAKSGADLRLPRRDRESARLAVMGFSRMLFRRDKRRLVAAMAKKSYFAEATALYGLHCLTSGEDVETFWRLADRLGREPSLNPIMAALERRHGPRPPGTHRGRGRDRPPSREQPSGRRRRRRGRRRGGQGNSGDAPTS